MTPTLSKPPCQVSIAERSHLSFALLIFLCIGDPSHSLSALSMVATSGRSRLPMAGPHTGTCLRLRLPMKDFTSRVRCMLL
jgi:hypothetical protein